jgi:hypothetical protein
MNMSNRKKVILSIFAGLFVALSLHAAVTGSITLSGSQGGILAITAVGNAAATSLDLTSAQTDLVVGTVTEFSNKVAGYSVTISSANAAGTTALLKSGTTPDSLPYTIKYGGVAVTFVAGVAPAVTHVTTKSLLAGTPKAITVTFDGTLANLAEGTYTDTLTFTIISP